MSAQTGNAQMGNDASTYVNSPTPLNTSAALAETRQALIVAREGYMRSADELQRAEEQYKWAQVRAREEDGEYNKQAQAKGITLSPKVIDETTERGR